MGKPLNILISGTNFWNPGDDFVRDGVVNVLRNLFDRNDINFHFYNFNADFFPLNKFRGISNLLFDGDFKYLKDYIDYIVIVSLSAGNEIDELYGWILENNLEDRVLLIGGGYDSNYAKVNLTKPQTKRIFQSARIIIGRTEKRPSYIDRHNLPYVHLPCPSLLSVKKVKIPNNRIGSVGMSIQIPKELGGIVNQWCDAKFYQLASDALLGLKQRPNTNVSVVAHHKYEYFHFLPIADEYSFPILYSSFYEDLKETYRRFDLVISTRLHACLFANANGVPSIILNDTGRHTHCIQNIPLTKFVDNPEDLQKEFKRIESSDLAEFAKTAQDFKDKLMEEYLLVLRNVV